MVLAKKIIPLISFLLLAFPFFGNAQGLNTTFGQNRLPYKDMDWQVLSSESIDAFYYEGGKNLAAYAQLVAEEKVTEIENLLSYRVGGKIEIAIFNTIEDLQQSNTGLKEQVFNVGGYTYVVDNKVIAYYNGTHADFERQIKEGIAEIILSEMIYGSSIQERVQSSSLLFLPSWFFKGLTSYSAENWSTEIDSRVRDGIISGKFEKFNWLSEEESILAGHSIWNYIASKYGKKQIPEILFLTRISRGFEGAFSYALGINSRQLINDWLEFYKKKYAETEADRTVPRKLLNIPDKVSKYPHTQLKTHPNGRKIAFVMNKNGLWKVKVYDKREKKERTVYTGGKHEGYQIINYDYPVLAWDPKGRNLGVIYFEKGETRLITIDNDAKVTGKHTLPETIDQVLSYDFADKKTLLLSAIKNGQTDLYLYDLDTKELTQLTNDIFDDLWPRFNDEHTQIIFSSNRPYDSLNFKTKYFETLRPENNFDVFVYNYPVTSNLLKRITNTPYVNEVQPVFYLPGYYSFTSDISGIYNAYTCKETQGFLYAKAIITKADNTIDSILSTSPLPVGEQLEIAINGKVYKVGDSIKSINVKKYTTTTYKYFPLTNYKRNMLGRDMASSDDAEYNLLMYEGEYQIFETNVSDQVEEDAQYIKIVPTEYRLSTEVNFYYGDEVPETALIIEKEEDVVTEQGNFTIVPKDSLKTIEEDSGAFFFQTEFPEDYILNRRKDVDDTEGNAAQKSIAKSFFTAMFPDYYVSQLDNSIINTYYHLNTDGNGPSIFANQNILLQVKTTMSDLLNNHRITAGVRIPFSLNGSDYFIEYQNKKHRINWEVSYFRLSRRNDFGIVNRQLVNQASGGIKIPFNETVALRTYVIGRQDRSIILGTDSASLVLPDNKLSWVGNKTELVYDNTKNIDINLPYGTRFKIFGEFYQNLEQGARQVINLGFDYRKYTKLHHKIIWANRFTVNASVGAAKVQYYIGGIENWVGPSYNDAVSRAQGSQYVFQMQANSLRGFIQNIRNGSNYMLFNSEIRIPLAAYLTQKPVRADYLRNFMLVPFIDIGTAWYNASPFGEQPYNTKVVAGPGYVVTVTNSESPFVGSTGIGIRSRVFGYYLRLDWAWGVVNGRFNDRITQFGLGYDF
jgi:hypothetical protein